MHPGRRGVMWPHRVCGRWREALPPGARGCVRGAGASGEAAGVQGTGQGCGRERSGRCEGSIPDKVLAKRRCQRTLTALLMPCCHEGQLGSLIPFSSRDTQETTMTTVYIPFRIQSKTTQRSPN